MGPRSLDRSGSAFFFFFLLCFAEAHVQGETWREAGEGGEGAYVVVARCIRRREDEKLELTFGVFVENPGCTA